MPRHLFALALVFAAAPSVAQETTPSVADHENWSVFVAAANDTDPKQCFIASRESENEVTQNGAPSTARRSDPILHVTNTPGVDAPDVVSAFLGYPPDTNQSLEIKIGSATFPLLAGADADSEWAWTRPDDDLGAVTAMRGGSVAVVTSNSRTGKIIVDSFSLIGFTAALDDARARCAAES